MQRFLWICLAGGIGSGTRYLIGLWAASRFGEALPYGTLIVNLVGCFLIAAVAQAAVTVASFPPTLRLVLTTGFLGGLTTYSSFNYDTTRLLATGARGAALLNFTLTVAGCFLAGVLGMAVTRRALG